MTSRYIGLDVGHKRTGVAVASKEARLAQPFAAVDTEAVLETISQIADETLIEAVIIGLPRSLNGNDTQQTKWIRDWVAEAKKALNWPLFWQDEALTTSVAAGRKLKSSLDAEAASIILQDWLDSDEASRVNC